MAPNPLPRATTKREVEPNEAKFSGFVFKIHANLDPKHRDRIAFLRVCSGKFERNKNFKHVRLDKQLKFANPYLFLAQSKEVMDDAYPGDVVGLYDTGNFKIGDTLTEGESFLFKGIPSFSPEIFKELINTDPMKSKQLEKGIQQKMGDIKASNTSLWGIKIDTKTASGKAYRQIEKVVKELSIDLVVMGTHGNEGLNFEKYFSLKFIIIILYILYVIKSKVT